MSAEDLPIRDERRKIVERARQQLREAKVIADYVNRLEMQLDFRLQVGFDWNSPTITRSLPNE
jgi:hypothetical protein